MSERLSAEKLAAIADAYAVRSDGDAYRASRLLGHIRALEAERDSLLVLLAYAAHELPYQVEEQLGAFADDLLASTIARGVALAKEKVGHE